MTAEAPAVAGHVDTSVGVEAGDPAFRNVGARDVVYIVPTAADDPDRWRVYRRGPPGELDIGAARPADLVAVLASPATEPVDVIDTPAWPLVLDERTEVSR